MQRDRPRLCVPASSCGERESERLHSIASRLHEQLDHIIEVKLDLTEEPRKEFIYVNSMLIFFTGLQITQAYSDV